MNLKELASKRVLGIPIVYIAAVVALGLAYFAYRVNKTNTADGTGDGTADGKTPAEPGSGGSANEDWSALNTNGTVVVQPQPVPSAAPKEETNQTWLQAAVDYVVNDAKVASFGDAQLALSKYLNGDDLSYAEGQIRDAAIQKLKLPPEPIGKIGQTAEKPAQKQGSNFPIKHTVKGTSDNTASKLANLYYGNGDNLHTDRIVEYNFDKGGATTTYSVGDVITIPAYTNPNYYTVTGKNGDLSVSTVAAKHGLSVAQIQALNPNLTYPLKVGDRIRTQ